MITTLYNWASVAATPFLPLFLQARMRAGKEDPARLRERMGWSDLPRPEGALVWLHAASVGETMSSLVLIEKILEENPAVSILLTTGTVTSADMAAKRLPPRAIHQYCPVDVPRWVGRFLDHWRPDAALWIESEIWPTLVQRTKRAGIPMALVNARLSQRSKERWAKARNTFRSLVSAFSVVLCQTEEGAESFRMFGIHQAESVGNLKFSAPALPVDADELAALRGCIGKRPVWLAASTHPGEEELVLETHTRLRSSFPGLLTIIVPRHPSRALEIETILKARIPAVARRTVDKLIGDEVELYIADTLGELGLFYALTPVAYIGGGMGTLGGHNPIEPAQQNTAILYGPDRGNFTTVAKQLEDAGAAQVVSDARALSDAVSTLLSNHDECTRRSDVAATVAKQNSGIVDVVMERLRPLLPSTAGDRK
ncbi:3-deoxy-D-manno-octulosonic acid transferase [Hwanghaeella grinnelliae]|uniref:3-deoxy-D-manno-octulosonic acid transferase n=1 Tax=Hwanghaeella grinnelliae TaxID=2500179 RepID=A0A3S2Z851_9PROT|nr:3-deoxy-D-manno-octulosonic acid transferase [Hwanghaeella grinnelliae]RVU36827.1 3-deoxy-D-manno-octulosonic acid transferase [Hwanghaeella grinnelliae]